jgi:hypothetical protein
VAPEKYRDIMLCTHFVAGWSDPNRPDYALRHTSTLVPAKLSAEKQESLRLSFEDYLASLAELNSQLVEGRWFRKSIEMILDVTTEMAIRAIAPKGWVALECDGPIRSVEAQVVSLFSQEPWESSAQLSTRSDAARAFIDLSSLGPLEHPELRRVISVKIRFHSISGIHRLKLVFMTPEDVPGAE